MDILIAVCLVVLALAVAYVVSAPLRAPQDEEQHDPDQGRSRASEKEAADEKAELDSLLTARENKYKEIRDAELDFRTGKLSSDDYKAIDAELRAEALEILDQLEALDRS